MTTQPQPDELTGAFGTARRIPRATYRDSHPAGLDGWIITAPGWHPLWSQYNLGVVSLAAVPGAPKANLQRPYVTHELSVATLNPEGGPYDAWNLGTRRLTFLLPVNIAEQFTTTDDEARRIALLCTRAVIDGILIPEIGYSPHSIRAHLIRSTWSTAIQQTLQHAHDPHHGHPN